MEQGRLFLAIALSFVIFFVWNFFFVDKEKIVHSKHNIEEKQIIQDQFGNDQITKIAEKEAYDENINRRKNQSYRTITVNSPYYTTQISEKGAEFTSFVLKHYREEVNSDSPLKELIPPEINKGTVRVDFKNNSISNLENDVFITDSKHDSLDIYDSSKEIVFLWVSPRGIIIEKKFFFSPDTYLIGLTVTIKNDSDQMLRDDLIVSLVQALDKKQGRFGFEGPSAFIDNKLEQVKIKKIKNKNLYAGQLKWIAVQDRYFIRSIIPQKPVEANMRLLLLQDDLLEAQYQQSMGTINPGTQHKYEFKLFFGPKDMNVLNKLDFDLDKSLNFGMFDFIAKPCLWLLNFLYSNFIPNYGVAIIVLTTIIKLILWPLGNKSYRSMSEMKKIQP